MNRRKIVLLAVVLAAIVAFFVFDLDRFLTLDYLKSRQIAIESYRQAHPFLAAAFYCGVYIAIAALSLPGAAIMTLAGGAIFGLVWGTVLVSFSSTIGATLAMLVARFVLRDLVQHRFADKLRSIDKGIEKEGAFFLFAMRLVPAFPFFIVNLVMGLTAMPALTFAWVSQLGMLPATVVFVNAGTQLAQIDELSGLLSFGLIGSLLLLAALPFVARWLLNVFRARRTLGKYRRPAQFDYNLVVIGAGSAGLVAAYIAAAVKARVALIEKDRMGGECLNTGCVPSKALIRTTRFLKDIQRAQDFGCKSAHVDFEFAAVMERVQRIIGTIAPHDSAARYASLGVDCMSGEARITSPYTVEVNGEVLRTRAIVVATGGRPAVPPIAGIDEVGYLTSENVWALRERPERLLVLGGGPIGCELAQCFARLGSKVTMVEMLPRLLIREDADIAERVAKQFADEGITVLTSHRASRMQRRNGGKVAVCERAGTEVTIEFDALLVAVGRAANTKGFGLEELGIPLERSGAISVNEYLQTNYPNIYACGDVAGPYQFTHVASHQAWYAAVNALFGGFRRFKVDYSVIPWATFTDPEVARVGLNETDAKEQGVEYEVTTYGIDDLDRAITDETAHGVVKVLTVPGKDRVLGVTIVGEHAADLIAEFVAAMRHGFGLNKILGTIHIYPTLTEANRYAAGNWKRAHAPERILRWLARWHRWRRGDTAVRNDGRLQES